MRREVAVLLLVDAPGSAVASLLDSTRRGLQRLRLPVLDGPGRWLALVAGCVTVGAGIALLLATGLGVGPYDVLITGVASRLGVSFGLASVAVSALATTLGWRLGGRVGPGTVAAVVLVGPAVDAWRWLLPPGAASLPGRVALLVAAVVLLGFGLAVIVAASLGPGPMEVLTLGLVHRGAPLRWARTALEGGVLALGWVLGGAVGVGTLFVALAIGHVLAVFVPRQGAGGPRVRGRRGTFAPEDGAGRSSATPGGR